MAGVIEKPRNGCALHGAVQTIGEIRGAVPIVHSNAGCGVQNYLANKTGGAAAGGIHGFEVPGTAVQERHIIFGGASRLREQIKNTVKVIPGDLYIVLNSCESAMVGDDIEAMTKEAQEQGEPVIESLLAGFHGDVHSGYERLLTDILTKLPIVHKTENHSEANLVNIFGILPRQDVFFKGDLEEIKRILKGIGVRANTFFGSGNGVEEFAKAPDAKLNLVFSQWGRKAAEKMKELYGIPYLEWESVPTGIEEVENFVQRVAEALELSAENCRDFIQEEKEYFSYYFERLAEGFYEEDYSKPAAMIGDERVVRQTADFLKKYLGAELKTAVITDYFPTEELPVSVKSRQLKDVAEEVAFSMDTREIYGILRHGEAQLILGSSLEEKIAQKENAVLLKLSYPVYNQSILNKTYAGVRGAVTLAEDYISAVKQANRIRKERLYAYCKTLQNMTAGV
jgi:nitrogenase molybdenum-iron protein beta chain